MVLTSFAQNDDQFRHKNAASTGPTEEAFASIAVDVVTDEVTFPDGKVVLLVSTEGTTPPLNLIVEEGFAYVDAAVAEDRRAHVVGLGGVVRRVEPPWPKGDVSARRR